MFKKLLTPMIVLLALLSIFLIEWYTPIHSDDYRYYLLGISPDAHYHHYMTWSGRIIADYASALILASESQTVYALTTALVTVAFCYFITKTPDGTLRWSKNDTVLFPLIFLTYWISNPNLGQTTFWIVGAANYLWTNLFVAAWLYAMHETIMKNDNKIRPLLVLLSFMAGCSNESVSPFVSLLSVMSICYGLWRTKTVAANRVVYSISAILGSCVLILSPGNFIRASGKEFWYGKSVFERMFIHLTERTHNHLALIWISYVVLFLLIMVVIFNKPLREKIKQSTWIFAALAVIIGVGTSLIMFASPSYPDRVMNGTFMFILLAVSFIARAILKADVKFGHYSVKAVVILCAITFFWSYTLMYKAYKTVAVQEVVRQQIIAHEIANGKRQFTIPEFYFSKLQNSGGQFGFFHDPAVYGKYYGVENVYRLKINFDYSVMAKGTAYSLSDAFTAYADAKGNLLLVGKTPISVQPKIIIDGKKWMPKSVTKKVANINDTWWYYYAIPVGKVENITL